MSSTLFCPNFSVNLGSYTICQCYPESWARYIHTQSEENQVSTYNTTTLQHSKMSSLSPTNPASGNFCRSAYWQVQRLHIQQHCFNFLWWSVEDLKAKWELITERSRHKQALLTLQLHFWSLFINCCFNHKLFHWACMKNFCLHSLMKFVQKWDFEQLCISQIETSTSLPPPWRAYPGHVTPSPSREERIWLSESSRGWGIWTARSISCEISGMASSHQDRGVRGFSWKRLCLWGQLVTSFVPYLKVFEF